MLPEPLHPAVVHFPIVLVVLLPIVAVAALLLIRRGADARRTWIPVLIMALSLAGASWLAVETGQHEEDTVEEVVAGGAIHEHEEAAERFLLLSGVLGLLAVGGLMTGTKGHVARSVVTVAAALLVVAGYQVGHTGGELVYEHGAASAYASVHSRATPRDGDSAARGERDDDHAEGEGRDRH